MQIDTLETSSIDSAVRTELVALCNEAYGEDVSNYFENIGPGIHLLGRVDGRLVAHLMFFSRQLFQNNSLKMRAAYVELVATLPSQQGRGHASALLRAAERHIQDFDIGALSPSAESFYARLGWEPWPGPLAVRTKNGLVPTPDEQVMILRLPRTPLELDVNATLSVEWRPGEIW